MTETPNLLGRLNLELLIKAAVYDFRLTEE